ncbi:MAG: hypothetical protein ACM33T_17470 [Solirubrobacterales bacterium]
MPRRALLLLLLPLLASAASAGEVQGERELVILDRPPSAEEIKLATRHGAHLLGRARAAKETVQLRVNTYRDVVMMNLLAPSLCDPAKGCPLLVIRDLSRRPVLETVAYANVLASVRGDTITLTFQSGQTWTECTFSRGGRGRCKPPTLQKPAG